MCSVSTWQFPHYASVALHNSHQLRPQPDQHSLALVLLLLAPDVHQLISFGPRSSNTKCEQTATMHETEPHSLALALLLLTPDVHQLTPLGPRSSQLNVLHALGSLDEQALVVEALVYKGSPVCVYVDHALN